MFSFTVRAMVYIVLKFRKELIGTCQRRDSNPHLWREKRALTRLSYHRSP
ncbi:unnamed protein product, partial [Plutella xylostella]